MLGIFELLPYPNGNVKKLEVLSVLFIAFPPSVLRTVFATEWALSKCGVNEYTNGCCNYLR